MFSRNSAPRSLIQCIRLLCHICRRSRRTPRVSFLVPGRRGPSVPSWIDPKPGRRIPLRFTLKGNGSTTATLPRGLGGARSAPSTAQLDEVWPSLTASCTLRARTAPKGRPELGMAPSAFLFGGEPLELVAREQISRSLGSASGASLRLQARLLRPSHPGAGFDRRDWGSCYLAPRSDAAFPDQVVRQDQFR
jgi:hypothetical protein